MDNDNSMWCMKYKPETLDEVVIDKWLREMLEQMINDTASHLLLYGGCGTGKTTICEVMCKELNGHKGLNVLEVNASGKGQNDIEYVKHTIEGFVRMVHWGTKYKIILLDEFDGMSKPAQMSLRKTMESSKNTIFFLTANEIHKVIEPIQSRCYSRQLTAPPINDFRDRVIYILNEEEVEFDVNVLNKHINIAYPDFRKCINNLQNHSLNNKLMGLCTQDFDGDRIKKYNRLMFLIKQFEYRRDYFKWKLTHQEKLEFKKLLCTDQFLVSKELIS